MILTLAKYTFIEVSRSRLFWVVMIGVAVVFSLILFAGHLAITERNQLQVTIMASVFRMGAVLLTALMVISALLREHHDKQLLLLLSLPMKRCVYFLGKFLGFSYIVLSISVLVSLPLLIFSNGILGVMFWGTSLFLELMIIMAASIFFQFTFSQVPAAMLGVVGFYAFSRSISSLLLISQNPIVPSDDIGQVAMEKIIHLLSYIIPRLDGFTQSLWLISDSLNPSEFGLLMLQGLIYVILFAFAALLDFYRKNLG